MTREDEVRWDRKWQEIGDAAFEPDRLLIQHQDLLTGGQALDLACGLGQNAIWLARHGYTVLAVDISGVALQAATEEASRQEIAGQVCFKQVDLDRWPIPAEAYDLICVFRFLDRSLFPAIRAGVRPGGLLFYATRHVGVLEQNPEANPDFLLAHQELPSHFAGWELLFQAEGPRQAELIARKPPATGALPPS
ncbi:MAG: class I SAM-dependent methyltransferase [Candidatus Promineifilaceae bacterium]